MLSTPAAIRGLPALLRLLGSRFVTWARRWTRRFINVWRRSIMLRVVVATLLLSMLVVTLLGAAVVDQVRDGLLSTKTRAALSQADGGFRQAQDEMAVRGGLVQPNMPDLLSRVVLNRSLAGGSAGVYEIALLTPQEHGEVAATGLGPRTTGDLSPTSVTSDLRGRVRYRHIAYRYVRMTYEADQSGVVKRSQPGIAIGTQVLGPDQRFYELYYLFPLSQEQATLNLVQRTLTVALVFLMLLIAAIAWLITRQVVTPVRMAARISERLAAGKLEERMRFHGEDDLARLSKSFNKMANSLQRQIRQLEHLSRIQRRFVSDVSHELRTPLTTVRMAADVLHEARTDFDPAVARSAELLQAQLDRFEALLTDLLEISRFDANAAVLDAESIDVRDIAQRVVDAAEPLAERRGSRLVVQASPEPCLAEADPRRIERVIRNLVVNAIEHGEGNDVIVRIDVNESAVAVAVRDYGVGLKPGESSLVFNRFWRADPARTRTTGGTGLGLAIALEDAHLHGGWLQAWGEVGDGSQFRLTLPRSSGRPLDRSPVPLEPEDSRRNRGVASVGVPYRRHPDDVLPTSHDGPHGSESDDVVAGTELDPVAGGGRPASVPDDLPIVEEIVQEPGGRIEAVRRRADQDASHPVPSPGHGGPHAG